MRSHEKPIQTQLKFRKENIGLTVMRAVEFANLCEISPAMVSKYKALGLLCMDGKEVDARTSLEWLSGSLGEDKRQKALAKLGELPDEPPVNAPATKALPATTKTKPITSKDRKEMFDAGLKMLEFRRKAGEHLLASDVAAQADLAISAMRETFSNGRRDMARAFCVQFDLSPDCESSIMRFLSDQFEGTLGRFADVARKMAEPTEEAILMGDLEDIEFSQAELNF